jgi:preprotein translocase subunit SecE
MNDYTSFAIWAGVIAVVFGVLWFTGNLAKLRNYVLETREELRKCTWPTMDELRGSTVVVMISVLILGAFTVAVDRVLFWCVTQMVRF